jgi:Spy/CpxP family protein refolding chaperone
MRSRRWILGLVAATGIGVFGLTGATGWAEAQDPATSGPVAHRLAGTPLGKFLSGRIGRAMVLRSELDLTPEQTKALRSTIKAHRAEIAQTIAPVAAKRRALRDAVLSDTTDEAAIRSAADDLGKAIGDAAVKAAKLRKVLVEKVKPTPEQVAKIKAFRADNDQAAVEFLEKMAGSKGK